MMKNIVCHTGRTAVTNIRAIIVTFMLTTYITLPWTKQNSILTLFVTFAIVQIWGHELHIPKYP